MIKKQAIFVMGPTAAGKTALAIELATKLPVDIISVDSAMVYRGMNIGTGKPSADILTKTPHALIDILDPAESYSVGKFCNDAYSKMYSSIEKGRIPLLVGGTMMYFWSLQQGLAELPDANQTIRDEITKEARLHGWPALHRKFQQLDPVAAEKIDPNDAQRIQRGLEVMAISDKPLSEYAAKKSLIADWQIETFVLVPEERAYLHRLIAERYHNMLREGFVGEVEELFRREDLHKGLPSIRAVGYRQIWEFLEGESSEEQMIERGIAATRQLAKRQFTWLNRWPKAHRLMVGKENICNEVLSLISY